MLQCSLCNILFQLLSPAMLKITFIDSNIYQTSVCIQYLNSLLPSGPSCAVSNCQASLDERFHLSEVISLLSFVPSRRSPLLFRNFSMRPCSPVSFPHCSRIDLHMTGNKSTLNEKDQGYAVSDMFEKPASGKGLILHWKKAGFGNPIINGRGSN